ncbi:hypothetical protein FACS189487_07490 [Campylobacterota bacterium]|nr:hypothetical protein FACS189487_07490 [Campylobacterota bacterium]
MWLYISIALYVGNTAEVGIYGKELSKLALKFLGEIIYIAPPIGFWLIWRAYRYPPTLRRWLETIASILLFIFAFLIIEALCFNRGIIGMAICEGARPIVGSVGVGVIAFFMILNAWFLAFRLTILDMLYIFVRSRLFLRFREFKGAASESFADMFPIRRSHDDDDLPVLSRKARGREIDYTPDFHPLKNSEENSQNRDIFIKDTEFDAPAIKRSKKQSGVQIVRELEENKKLLEQVEKGRSEKPKDFVLPPLGFLAEVKAKKNEVNEAEIDIKVAELLEKLRTFKIDGDVVRTYTGPVVTTFEFKPASHVKVSRILSLENDIAMALRAQTIRIQAPIPGKDVVGIEIPNASFETIYLREMFDSPLFREAASPLTIALGKDIVGKPFVTDLKKLPHLLIAGTTGSGKSVGINAMILSLLYRNSPDTLRLIMIDPKMLEFGIYNDIPHLLTQVITKPKQAIIALANTVREMERRYEIMSKTKTKNIESYNQQAASQGYEPLPFIVVVIDELADLMMNGGKEVEISIARLAQMARASGIHLIVATQRPSVDVITGLIKANLPSRISYRVGTKIDSKVILDSQGAESLLGRGDMLFTPPGSVGLVRLHAPFSSENEIERVAEFLKQQRKPDYDVSFLAEAGDTGGGSDGQDIDGELDELYEEAKQIVLTERKSSISYVQRRLQIGYNRAARLVEQLEKTGVLSEQNSKGQREIL